MFRIIRRGACSLQVQDIVSAMRNHGNTRPTVSTKYIFGGFYFAVTSTICFRKVKLMLEYTLRKYLKFDSKNHRKPHHGGVFCGFFSIKKCVLFLLFGLF